MCRQKKQWKWLTIVLCVLYKRDWSRSFLLRDTVPHTRLSRQQIAVQHGICSNSSFLSSKSSPKTPAQLWKLYKSNLKSFRLNYTPNVSTTQQEDFAHRTDTRIIAQRTIDDRTPNWWKFLKWYPKPDDENFILLPPIELYDPGNRGHNLKTSNVCRNASYTLIGLLGVVRKEE